MARASPEARSRKGSHAFLPQIPRREETDPIFHEDGKREFYSEVPLQSNFQSMACKPSQPERDPGNRSHDRGIPTTPLGPPDDGSGATALLKAKAHRDPAWLRKCNAQSTWMSVSQPRFEPN